MNVILFGATGMIGSGTLVECLADSRIEQILVIGRRSTGVEHEKVRELLISDFYDYSTIEDQLVGYDACLFCLGTTSVGKNEEEYRHQTNELTLAAATMLVRLNPEMTFCYVSAEGADPTGKSRQMWARVRGELENDLTALPFRRVLIYRPFYIQPVTGVSSATRVYRLFYKVLSPLYPLLRRIFPNYLTTTEMLGQALIEGALSGAPTQVLRSREINALAEKSRLLIKED
ncbi:MAG: epimerase [Ignavibacteriae bacterium]|nr:epimerase [Ignavibacteriota bacterium]MCB9216716.1 epimerase [Ignavibacteria bacterium]